MTDRRNSNLWTTLSDEILDGFSEDEANDDDGLANSLEDLVSIETGTFTFDPRSSDSSLTHLHPPTIQIFRLWQVFLSNVNPLVKVIHAPMVQQQILESSVNIENVSRPVESFMFAIYSCAITSLSAEECEKLTGESRELLRPKYHKAAQQALIRAGLFKTLDIQVLQAAVLFLVSILDRFHYVFHYVHTLNFLVHEKCIKSPMVYISFHSFDLRQLGRAAFFRSMLSDHASQAYKSLRSFDRHSTTYLSNTLCRYLSVSTTTLENSGFSQV